MCSDSRHVEVSLLPGGFERPLAVALAIRSNPYLKFSALPPRWKAESNEKRLATALGSRFVDQKQRFTATFLLTAVCCLEGKNLRIRECNVTILSPPQGISPPPTHTDAVQPAIVAKRLELFNPWKPLRSNEFGSFWDFAEQKYAERVEVDFALKRTATGSGKLAANGALVGLPALHA